MKRGLVLAVGLGALGGCHGDKEVPMPDGSRDSGARDSWEADSGQLWCKRDNATANDNKACNRLQPCGEVLFSTLAENPPLPTGGTISSGTYALASITAYSGPGGTSGVLATYPPELLSLTGSGNEWTYQFAIGRDGHESGALVSSGGQVTTTNTCWRDTYCDGGRCFPEGGWDYIASENEILFFFWVTPFGETVVHTYAKNLTP